MTLNSRYPTFGIGVGVCLLVSVTICMTFTYDHVSSSGSSLCIPGLSIRCEPDDCSSHYVRCGRNQKQQEVPGNKVCYKGALVSVNSRMHSSGLLPHNCRERTFYNRNSTIEFDLKACNCPLVCTGTNICVCYCLSGESVTTKCMNNDKTYNNSLQAKCCVKTCEIKRVEDSEVSSSRYWSLWTEALDFGRVVIGSSLKQMCDSLRNRFTFPPTMEAEACCTRSKDKCNQC